MMTEVKFGGTSEEQNELSQLVLIGDKTATSSLLELKTKKNITHKDDIWKILNGSNEYVCTVRVIKVENKEFQEITEEFAIKEGDGTFKNWLDIHSNYYSFLLKKIGKELTETTLLECVYFEKIVI